MVDKGSKKTMYFSNMRNEEFRRSCGCYSPSNTWDNMGKTCSTHGDTKGSAIQEIECLPVFPELKVGRFFLP